MATRAPQKTRFDLHVRVVECKKCGGAVDSPLLGGQIQCRYCNAINLVRARIRRSEETRRPHIEETARLHMLYEQAALPTRGHEYDFSVPPPGLARIDAAARNGDSRTVYNAWLQDKRNAKAAGAQRRITYLAMLLAGLHYRANNPLAARATLDTALDSIEDEGHADMLRYRLAAMAAQAGEIEAAEAWIAECDPSPTILALDGERRYAQGKLALARGDSAGALAAVGATPETFPTDPHHRLVHEEIRCNADPEAARRRHATPPLSPLFGNVLMGHRDLPEEQRRAHAKQNYFWLAVGAILMIAFVTVPYLVLGKKHDRDRGHEPWPSDAPDSSVDAEDWKGDEPFECHRGHHSIRGVKASFDGPAIKMYNECTVYLDDVDLKGDPVVHLQDDAKLIVRGGELRSEAIAVDAYDASVLELKGGTIRGKKAALDLDGGVDLELGDAELDGGIHYAALDDPPLLCERGLYEFRHTRVKASDRVLILRGTCTVRLIDVYIEADNPISTRGKSRLTVTNSTIIGSETALHGASESRIELRSGSVKGTMYAIDLEGNALVELAKEFKVRGERRVNQSGKLVEK